MLLIGGLFGLAVSAGLFVTIAAGWITVAVFSISIFYIFAYMIATLGLLPALAGVPAPGSPAVALPAAPLELLMRGFLIGLTAGLNFAIWALLPVPLGWLIGLVLAIIALPALFPAIARNVLYQAFLGWSSWLRPMSWLATGVGVILFVLNLPLALAASGVAALRLDRLTGTIETTGGALIGVTGFIGGFNLGNFTFLTPGPPAGLPFGPPPAGGSLSSHETGHTLNAAAFGGVFHWINAFDENPPGSRRTFAYGELTAESHFPRAGAVRGPGPAPGVLVALAHVRVWS